MKIHKIFLTFLSGLALFSCSSNKKPTTDCSTVFEDPGIFREEISASTTGEYRTSKNCKVLPIKFSKEIKCEVAGSDSTENLIKSYEQNVDDRVVLVIPTRTITDHDLSSYKNLITYYHTLVNLKKHVDSDLFNSLDNYAYKGLKCEGKGGKFVGWIGKKQLILSYEGKIVKEEKAHAPKNQATKKKGKPTKNHS